MQISFEAPAGFSLTNGPQAIRISGPNGISGEFGGGPMPEGNLNAYAQALATQVLGDTTAEVTNTTAGMINGVPAIVMQMRVAVRDGAVPLAIAVYDC